MVVYGDIREACTEQSLARISHYQRNLGSYLKATNIPGRYIAVITATTFMVLESFLVALVSSSVVLSRLVAVDVIVWLRRWVRSVVASISSSH